MATIVKTDIELQMNIFKLEASFQELIRDMYNKSFTQTIINRQSELYSDYVRDSSGTIIINNKEGHLRVELFKDVFVTNIADYIDNNINIFNPNFTEFIITETNKNLTLNEQTLKSNINIMQQQLLNLSEQTKSLSKAMNDAIRDKENLKENYEKIIEGIYKKYNELQKKYELTQKELKTALNKPPIISTTQQSSISEQ